MRHTPSPSPLSGPAGDLPPLVGQIRPSHAPPATRFTSFSPPTERVSLAHDYLLVMRGAEHTFAAMASLRASADLHPALRRAGHRPALRGSRDHHLAAAAPRRRPVQLQAAAAALPSRRGAPATAILRRRNQQQQRLCARPAGPRGRGAYLLLLHPVSLRLGRAGVRPRRGPSGAAPAAAQPAAQHPQVGPCRQPPRRRLHRDLRARPRADQALLWPRRRDRAPAGGDPPLPAGHTGRLAADRLRARPPQARARRARGGRRARVPIRVVGSGPDHAALQAAYPEAEFLGRAGDDDLVELYATAARCSCRAWRSLASPWSRRRQPDAR